MPEEWKYTIKNTPYTEVVLLFPWVQTYHNKALSLCNSFYKFYWKYFYHSIRFDVHRIYLGLILVWLAEKYTI